MTNPIVQAAYEAQQQQALPAASPTAAPPPALEAYRLPDGRVEYMDHNSAAIRQGTLATPADIAQADQDRKLLQEIQNEGFSGSLKALGEGFTGGLIPGGVDLIRAHMTPEERERARVRAQEHGFLTGTGEVFGMAAQQAAIAALIASGAGAPVGAEAEAAALAARGQQMLARPLAQRIGAHAAESLARGAATGAQLTFNEEARENLPHDAERVVHGALVGAVLEPIMGVPLGLMADRKAMRMFASIAPEGTTPRQLAAGLEVPPGVGNEHAASVLANSKYARRDLEVPFTDVKTAPLAWADPAIKHAPAGIGTSGVDQEVAATAGRSNLAGREARVMASQADKITEESAKTSTTAFEIAGDNIRETVLTEKNLNFGALADRAKQPEIAKLGNEILIDAKDALVKASGKTDDKALRDAMKFMPGFGDEYNAFVEATVTGDVARQAQSINTFRQQLGAQIQHLTSNLERKVYQPTQVDMARKLVDDLTKLQDKIAKSQRQPAIFGDKYAKAIEDIHDPLSKLIEREKNMHALGLLTREGESPYNTYEIKRGINANTLKAILTDPASTGTFKQAEVLFGTPGEKGIPSYLQLTGQLAEGIEKHFPSAELRQAREEINAANYLTESLRQMSARANLAKNTIDAASKGGGLQATEAAARIGAATLAAATVGPAGVPLGYGVGAIGGHMMNYGKRVQSLNALENMVDRIKKREAASVKTFVARRGAPVKPLVVTVDQSNKIVKALRSMAVDPTKTAEVTSDKLQAISTYAPKLASLAAQKMAEVSTYISQRLPRTMSSTNILQPPKQDKPMSPPERQSLVNMTRAAVDPHSILIYPSREGARLVRDMYPNEFASMQMALLTEVGSSKKPVPFSLRQQMALLFELPSDILTDPKRYVEFQELLDKKQKSEPKAAPIPVDIAEQFKTMTNKIEES